MEQENLCLTNAAVEAVGCLRQIILDEGQKAADRISAAKLLMEYGLMKNQRPLEETVLTVRFEDVPESYLE